MRPCLRTAALVMLASLACLLAGDHSSARSGTGDCPAPCPAPSVAGEAVPSAPPVPIVALHVRVPPSVGVGQELAYRLVVENQSRAPAHHVLLRNPFPAHARYVRAQPEPSLRTPELAWELGTLEGGASKEVTLVLAATGTGDVRNCARVQFEHGQCVTTKVARPGISVRKSGPTRALLYDNLSFRVTITNTGAAEVTNVVLTENLSQGLEHALGNRVRWNVGTLAPGQVRDIDYQAIAKQPGVLRGATVVTADGGLRDEAESSVTVGEPKLTLQMTGPAEARVNTGTPYQISVRNTGTAALGNVAVNVSLPAQASVVGGTQGGQMTGKQVQWLLGTLAPNATRVLDLVLRVPTSGSQRLETLATADRGLKEQAAVATTFAGVPAVTLDVTVTDDPVEVGRSTRYRITVRNPGTQAVTQVRVMVTLPEQLGLVRASATKPADHRREGPKILYEPVTLPANAEHRYEVEAKALKPGDVRVQVDLTADQLTAGTVTQRVSTTIYQDNP